MTTVTPEREAEIRLGAAAAQCDYVSRCNSSKCPMHGGQARALRDALTLLDDARARLASVEVERDAGIADAWRQWTGRIARGNAIHHREIASVEAETIERCAQAMEDGLMPGDIRALSPARVDPRDAVVEAARAILGAADRYDEVPASIAAEDADERRWDALRAALAAADAEEPAR